MAALVAKQALELLGCHVTGLHCDLDGRFPNHHPDPTVLENLDDLIQAVKQHKADVGIGYDGDADRIGTIDEQGSVLWGDRLMVVYARDILAAKPGSTIISEVKSSQSLYDDIAKQGADRSCGKLATPDQGEDEKRARCLGRRNVRAHVLCRSVFRV